MMSMNVNLLNFRVGNGVPIKDPRPEEKRNEERTK